MASSRLHHVRAGRVRCARRGVLADPTGLVAVLAQPERRPRPEGRPVGREVGELHRQALDHRLEAGEGAPPEPHPLRATPPGDDIVAGQVGVDLHELEEGVGVGGDRRARVGGVEHEAEVEGAAPARGEEQVRSGLALHLVGVPGVGLRHAELSRVEQAGDGPALLPLDLGLLHRHQNSPRKRPPRRSISRRTRSSNASTTRSTRVCQSGAASVSPAG